MSDADMLRPLSRWDEVEATTVGDGDQQEGVVEPWCELVLDMSLDGRTQRVEMTRHDAELVIEVLHTVLHPHTNRHSPAQRLWAELDDVMDFLMDNDDPEPEDRARAKALAEAIALITQPWSEEPDVGAVREEAVRRWEERE